MGALKCSVWALPRGAEARPLPHLKTWTVSPTEGDAGLFEFAYPPQGRGYELLAKTVDDDVDLEVEVTLTALDGRTWQDRAIIDEADLDDVAETGLGSFRGRLLSCLFDEVVIPYMPGAENGETVFTGTAGKIARTFLQAAQARGCLQGVTWKFTDTHDSAGRPWANQGTLKFSPGQKYRAMLGVLRGYQLSEWQLTPGRELVLVNVDGLGVDRTVGANPLTLERGRDLSDAPRKWRIRDAITALVAGGAEGKYSSFSDATAQARRGRRIEGYYSFGNTADQGTLDALTQRRTGTQVNGRTEVSHKIPLSADCPTPLIDFRDSDYLYSATRAGVARRRARQVSVSGDENGAQECNVTLGVLIDEAAVRQQEQLDALASGESIAGTSAPPPEVDDGSTPPTPTGITANSLWFVNTDGNGECSVTAVWQPVTDAALEGYVVEWRYTAAALGTGWRRMAMTDGTSLSWSSMSPGKAVEVRVAARNKWGRLGAFSTSYPFVLETDKSAPPTSSTPAPYVSLGFIVCPWDGKGSAGEPMPGDFLRAEVHVSTTSGFTPHRPLLSNGHLDEKSSTTYAGELRGATDLVVDTGVAGYGTTFYVRLVLVDRTGNSSAPSAQGSVVGRGVQDGEIAEMSVSKLKAGVITALVGIGNRLYAGSPTGAGWEGDAAGFRFYSMVGGVRTAVLEFVASTASLLVTGRFQTGRTGQGRAELSERTTDYHSLRFYPSSDETRWGEFSSYIPGNNPNSIALDMQSSAAPNLDHRTRVYVTPGQAAITVNRPTDGTAVFSRYYAERDTLVAGIYDSTSVMRPRGGNLKLARFGTGETTLERYNDGGGVTGSLRMGDDFVQLSVNTNNRLFLGASGAQLISNGQVKSFVIDHPTDPARWLVHGCTESPDAGVEYTGVATIRDHAATVVLPDYFEGLVDDDGRTVQVTVELDDELAPEPDDAVADAPGPAVDGEVWPPPPGMLARPEWALLARAAASPPRDGRFRIACDGEDGTRVAWHVRGRRRGTAFDVEPLRAEVDAHGDGPYRYLTPKGQAA